MNLKTLQAKTPKVRRKTPSRKRLARESKVIVALAFRNGPIENVHAGKICPTCAGNPAYSHITDEEMKCIIRCAVNRVYEMLCEREFVPESYEKTLRFGESYAANWDEPESVIFPLIPRQETG
jgi:hypothetical protein